LVGIEDLNLRAQALTVGFIVALFACLPVVAAPAARDKNVWSYDGGVILETDGSISNGPCFRVAGRIYAPGFFDNLKRFDTNNGAVFRRGNDKVETFPDLLTLGFIVRDHPCSIDLRSVATHGYLTRSQMSSLKLSLYWKHGVELRPVTGVEAKYFSVDPIRVQAVGRVGDPPERLVWSFEFSVTGASVPLTDSLVLIFREPDGRIAARVAARM
jgi:hypothetical protein